MNNPDLIENIYDRNEGKKNQQDYARDYAITLNLGEPQQKKYNQLEDTASSMRDEQLVNLRVKQLALAKILVKIHGREAFLLVKGHTHLGHAYLEYKCYDQAYDHLKIALERNREPNSSADPDKYRLYILKLLTHSCLESHRVKESILYLEEAENICKENEHKTGTVGKEYAQVLAFKGDYFSAIEKYEEAIGCYEDMGKIYQAMEGENSEGCANSVKQIVKIYDQIGDYEQALENLEDCICLFRCSYTTDEVKITNLINQHMKKIELIGKLRDKERDDDAVIIDCYRHIKDLHVDLYGDEDKKTQKALRNLAIAQSKRKQYFDALDTIRNIERVELHLYGERSKAIAKTYCLKATLLFRIDEKAKGKEQMRKAAWIYEEIGDKNQVRAVKEKLRLFEDKL